MQSSSDGIQEVSGLILRIFAKQKGLENRWFSRPFSL
jgi:hypothetical protein